MTSYEVWLADDYGRKIRPLDNLLRMNFSRSVTAVGYCVLEVPEHVLDLRRDWQLHIYRKAATNRTLEGVYLIRRWTLDEDKTLIEAWSLRVLAERRINAYYAATANRTEFSNKPIDTIMADVWNYNFVAGYCPADRILDGAEVATGGLLDSIDKGCAWKTVASILDDLAATAWESGTTIYWDVIPRFPGDGTVDIALAIYSPYPGQDKTTGQSLTTPVLFGPELGNATEVELSFDYQLEITTVYVGGRGEQSERRVQTVSSGQEDQSRWNRSEAFFDARNEYDSDAALVSSGYQFLHDNAGMVVLTAQLHDDPQSRYGVDWLLGDRVTVQAYGMAADCTIETIHVTSTPDDDRVFALIRERLAG